MRTRLNRCFMAAAIATALAAPLTGCGGGGGGGGFLARALNITVAYPQLSAGATDLSGAQSAQLTVKAASPSESDVNMIVERPTSPAPVTSTYTVPTTSLKDGPHDVALTFFNQHNATGVVVGVAAETVVPSAVNTTTANNTTTTTAAPVTLTLTPTVASVTITAGQSVIVGNTFLPTFSALDVNSNVVALGPSDAQLQITSGADKVKIVTVTLAGQTATQQQIEGLAAGTATLIATVKGVASAPVTITVVSNSTGMGGIDANLQ